MAEPKPAESAATRRAARAAQQKKDAARKAQQKADRAEARSLKQQQRDARRERNKLPYGRERKEFDKLQRDLGAKERELRRKTYN